MHKVILGIVIAYLILKKPAPKGPGVGQATAQPNPPRGAPSFVSTPSGGFTITIPGAVTGRFGPGGTFISLDPTTFGSGTSPTDLAPPTAPPDSQVYVPDFPPSIDISPSGYDANLWSAGPVGIVPPPIFPAGADPSFFAL